MTFLDAVDHRMNFPQVLWLLPYLVEILDSFADNNGLCLDPSHQVLDVPAELCFVLDEAHGHVIVSVTALQAPQEHAVGTGAQHISGEGAGMRLRTQPQQPGWESGDVR